MIWTVVRFPNGSWSYGGRPDSPDYAGCEVWRIYAATGKIAVKRAQSRRRSDAASKARLAEKDTAPGQAENRGQPVMEDLTWEAQIERVRKEYEDGTSGLRARFVELEAEVKEQRRRDAVLDQIAEIEEETP